MTDILSPLLDTFAVCWPGNWQVPTTVFKTALANCLSLARCPDDRIIRGGTSERIFLPDSRFPRMLLAMFSYLYLLG